MVAAHCQAEKLLGYRSHSHCESKNNPVGCRWAQPGTWAYGGQEARRIKHVLGRIKTGPSRQPTPQGTLLYGGWGWDVGIYDLSWGKSCSFWGSQLCCCGLNPELGKTVPCRHLRSSGAYHVGQTGEKWGLSQSLASKPHLPSAVCLQCPLLTKLTSVPAGKGNVSRAHTRFHRSGNKGWICSWEAINW